MIPFLRIRKLWWILVMILVTTNMVHGNYYDKAKLLRQSLLSSIDPVVQPAETVEVGVGFSLLSITRLTSDDSSLSAVGWFTITWTDSYLSWDSTSGSFVGVTLIQFKEGEIWRPELRVENSISDVDILANEHHKYLVQNGTVVWEAAKQVTVHCTQDLAYFPFDKQKCHVTLTSWSHDVSQIVLTSLRGDVDRSYYGENAEWTLYETSVSLSNQSTTSGGVPIVSSRLTITLNLERLSGLLGLTFLFPLVLLSMLNIMVFALSIDSGEKVTYNAVILLSMVVYFTTTIGYFPASKTVPIRVSYMIVVLLLSCLSMVCTFAVLWLYNQKADREMSTHVIQISNFLGLISCTNGQIEVEPGSKHSESSPNTSRAAPEQLPKQLTPIQNGGSHIVAPSIETMDKLPPVNEHLRKNKIRPKSGESVYSVSKKKGKQTSTRNNWQQFAFNMDRFFLYVFIMVTFLVHFIFLVTLGAGGSSAEP